jgi:hypothetical protein
MRLEAERLEREMRNAYDEVTSNAKTYSNCNNVLFMFLQSNCNVAKCSELEVQLFTKRFNKKVNIGIYYV